MNRKLLIWAFCLVLLSAGLLVGLLWWPIPNSVAPPSPQRPATTPKPISTPFQNLEVKPRPMPEPVSSLAPWETNLNDILTAPGDNSTAARKLLEAIPRLPVEAQEQYIAHALNLCEDADFSKAEEIYLRQNTPPSVAEAIFNDALNRPDEVKLPLMAKTMALPNHPMAGEARQILELYLELEPGASPSGSWEIAVREYLTKQP
jgi:hypothetical protein